MRNTNPGKMKIALIAFVLLAVLVPNSYCNESSSNKDPWLLIVRETNDGCRFDRFNTDKGAHQLLATIESCPEKMFLAKNGRRISWYSSGQFYFRSITMDESATWSIPIPSLEFEAHRENMKVLPPKEVLDKFDNLKFNVMSVGKNEKDEYVTYLTLGLPYDDTYDYLFTLVNGSWTVSSEKYCVRFDTDCSFKNGYIDAYQFKTLGRGITIGRFGRIV